MANGIVATLLGSRRGSEVDFDVLRSVFANKLTLMPTTPPAQQPQDDHILA